MSRQKKCVMSYGFYFLGMNRNQRGFFCNDSDTGGIYTRIGSTEIYGKIGVTC